MATYIALMNWTDQGIKTVKESPKRSELARAVAKKLGCELTKFYMTIGSYDMVAFIKAPDAETVAKFLLSIGGAGNVRTTTLRAFSEDSYKRIVGSL